MTRRFRKADEPDWARVAGWASQLEGALATHGDEVARRGVLLGFMQELYDAHVVYSFDWPAWQGEAIRLYENRTALEAASLSDLRKLLTTHARKDHFCEGHLEMVFENGHLHDVLREVAKHLAAEAERTG